MGIQFFVCIPAAFHKHSSALSIFQPTEKKYGVSLIKKSNNNLSKSPASKI